MVYVDLNMVRAGAVRRPDEWEVAGYNEIRHPWLRKGVIDFDKLNGLLQVSSRMELIALLDRALDEQIAATQRDPMWTESPAVGDDEFRALMTSDR